MDETKRATSTRCSNCDKAIPHGAAKIAAGGRWLCPDCEYRRVMRAQQR